VPPESDFTAKMHQIRFPLWKEGTGRTTLSQIPGYATEASPITAD